MMLYIEVYENIGRDKNGRFTSPKLLYKRRIKANTLSEAREKKREWNEAIKRYNGTYAVFKLKSLGGYIKNW